MEERDLRALIEEVRRGRLSRRDFIQGMVSVGLAAPLASQLLMHAGIAQAQTKSNYKPTKRGGGGPLRALWWQGATLLNPHFATGTKDQEGSRIFYEPLAGWDNDGNLVAILAAEVPSVANGGVSKDGKSVFWKVKKDVQWHDGKPLTADDVLFTWEYASNPETATVTIGSYKDVKATKVDAMTVRLDFDKPTPFWANAFVGAFGAIIPKHLFGDFTGSKSRDAPANLKPVGTGPYKFVDFKPGDLVRGELNPNYHMPNRPYFDTIEMKGGGDAVSAARAVLQTGEFDYAWNIQVEDEILKRLEAGGKGRTDISGGGNIEFIQLNSTDPNTEVDGERSSIKTKHFAFSDPAVRKAMALLIDRQSVQDHIYGRTGIATGNFLNRPERFDSKNTRWEFNVEKANAMLDAAGWKKGGDGIREKNGKKLKFLYQTSINAPRQKTQQVIKQACQKAGIELELKSVTPSVFFSSDTGNPDTYPHFYADMQMYTTTMTQPDPEVFMNQFLSWEVANKENKWQGRNITRWTSDEYDKTWRAAQNELDPVKRAALYIKCNDLVVGDPTVIPVVYRPRVQVVSKALSATLSGWDLDFWALQDWYRG